MYDIINRTNGGIKSSNTYNGLFSVDENGKYWLRILSPLKPIVKGTNLEFVTGEVDPSILGIQSSPDQIIKLWEEYETKGFPLEEMAQSLYVVELMGLIKSWDTPSVIKSWESPHVTLLVEVIVLLEY
jgi:hypothetical protein